MMIGERMELRQRRRHTVGVPQAAYAAEADEDNLAALRALAETLTARRLRHGYTVKALASLFGVSRATITRALKIAGSAPASGMTTRVAARLRMRLLVWLNALETLEERGAPEAATQARPPTPSSAQPIMRKPAPRGGTAARLHKLASYRVLILENDSDIIDIYRLALAEATHEPSYAARYEARVVSTLDECLGALEAAQREHAPFDALIMDLSVRDLQSHAARQNGSSTDVALLREAGARRLLDGLLGAERLLPRGRLVVSGMAPYHLRQVSAPLARLGAAYLPKPFDIEDLLVGLYSLCAPGMRPAASLSFFLPPDCSK